MQDFTLIKPDISHKDRYLDYVVDWKDERMVPYSSRPYDKTFEDWLEEKKQNEDPLLAPKEFVAASTYLFMKGETIIGVVNSRHELNDRLFAVGGHIGSGIRPSERGKGYAKIMLHLSLQKAKELGIEAALITCDEPNLHSWKTIESCGGVLENKLFDIDHYVLRYWFDLSK